MAEYQKCTNCKGTGRVPAMNKSTRWMSCPICGGKGRKLIKKSDNKRKA